MLFSSEIATAIQPLHFNKSSTYAHTSTMSRNVLIAVLLCSLIVLQVSSRKRCPADYFLSRGKCKPKISNTNSTAHQEGNAIIRARCRAGFKYDRYGGCVAKEEEVSYDLDK